MSSGERWTADNASATRFAAVGAGGGLGEQVEGFGHEPVDPPAGIEAAIGVLEHDLDPGAERTGHLRHDGLSEKPDIARLHRVEAKDRAGKRGLAATALADEAEGLALAEGEGDGRRRPAPAGRARKPARRPG